MPKEGYIIEDEPKDINNTKKIISIVNNTKTQK